MTDVQTPAQARMAHARAHRNPPAQTRYDALRASQKRSDEVADRKRAHTQARTGIILPDDAEPPFDPNPDVIPYGHVRVRCLRRGHDKISMGLSLPLETDKFPRFHQDEVFVAPEATAEKYESDDAYGWVEIIERP